MSNRKHLYLASCTVDFGTVAKNKKNYTFCFVLDDLSEARQKMIAELNSFKAIIDTNIARLHQIQCFTVNMDIYTRENKDFVSCDNSIFMKYDSNKGSFVIINQIAA